MEELPSDRLSTIGERGSRVYLYPAAVKGFFRRRRMVVQSILMLIFICLPWIHINGQQILFLDIARRNFYIFGLHFRAHDAPFILFLILSFAFLIGFVTSIWGRVWCGWACPQTVFTELVFRKIEAFIEGNHRERKALDERPMDGDKFLKKTLKYTAFFLVSSIVAHSFLAYFVGSYEMIQMLENSPEKNWASFLVSIFVTGLVLFDFGWFREQFCVIMCPYGRFQSVMLGSNSLVVAYDTKRGEPRRGITTSGAPVGDCVNCFRCVQVCPTGIDIRRGLQMECVACTACIDVCDEVMEKIHKPKGLIRYTTLAQLSGQARKYFHSQTIAYIVLLLCSVGGLAFTLSQKQFLDVAVLRAKGNPYEIIKGDDEIIVNHFHLEIFNQTGRDILLNVRLPEEWEKMKMSLVMPSNPVQLKDSASQRADFFVKFPASALNKGSKNIPLLIESQTGNKKLEVPLVGPGI